MVYHYTSGLTYGDGRPIPDKALDYPDLPDPDMEEKMTPAARKQFEDLIKSIDAARGA